MRITYYDLETTGLDPVRSDIIQVAYATFDDDKCVRSDVMHFFYDGMSHSAPDALEKHHMSYEYLMQYKDQFTQNRYKLFSYLDGARVAGFNNHWFDDHFLEVWLKRMGAPVIEFKETLDVMKLAAPIVHKPRISLINLCKYFGLTEEDINSKCQEWFGTTGAAHSAYYDVAATRLCHMKEIEAERKAEEEYFAQNKSSMSSSGLTDEFMSLIM